MGFFIVIGLVFAASMVSMTLGCRALGLVCRDEYLNHHDQWVRDGKPLSAFWVPKDAHLSLSSLWAYGSCQVKWLLVTPSWIRDNRESSRRLRTYRVLTVSGFSVWVILLVVLAWVS